jgi:hypothetical protein
MSTPTINPLEPKQIQALMAETMALRRLSKELCARSRALLRPIPIRTPKQEPQGRFDGRAAAERY